MSGELSKGSGEVEMHVHLRAGTDARERVRSMKEISLVVFDFDGVMTDNRVRVHQSGDEAVWCHRGDGLGIARLREAAFDVFVVSTEANPVVGARCRKLNIQAIQNCHDKLSAVQEVATTLNVKAGQVAYVGNDINDLACMEWVGWPIAVADALPAVRAVAKWVTHLPGGGGAVREVADRLIGARLNADPAVDWVRHSVWQSLQVKQAIAGSEQLLSQIVRVARMMTDVFRAGGRVFFFGNGGSAADAQHLAAELVGRFALERRPLPAMALSVNSSVVTAIGNDYGYEHVFARQLEGLAHAGDMATGITTSGNSVNVIRAMQSGREMGLRTIAMTGAAGGEIQAVVDECLCVPSDLTPRIQEGHILIGHLLCEYAERALFGNESSFKS
jgi:D-sedoheptulose 7-phosphate isomerase